MLNALSRKLAIRSVAAGAALAAALCLAGPGLAQLRIYQDYEVSDRVWEMTLVDVEPGMVDTYLEGLKSTWVAANEVAKGLGHIEDYAIYGNQFGGGDEFDLVLVVQMANTTDLAPNRERYNQFMQAWGEQNMERSNQTVRDLYNRIREIQGTHLLRRITIRQ